MAPASTVVGSGIGLGWLRVSHALREFVPVSEIADIWLFAPVRRDGREWGVAVVGQRVAGERRRIYTASYVVVLRGKERGHGRVTVQEIGEGPASVLHDVIRGVQQRSGDNEPPSEVLPEEWYVGGERSPGPGATGASHDHTEGSSTGVPADTEHTESDQTGGLG